MEEQVSYSFQLTVLTHEHVAAETGVVLSALEHTLACPVSLSVHALMGMFIAQVQSKHRCVLLNGVHGRMHLGSPSVSIHLGTLHMQLLSGHLHEHLSKTILLGSCLSGSAVRSSH